MNHLKEITSAIKLRNKMWEENPIIPSWVDINNVALDQFFTKKDVAIKCYENLLSFLKKKKINLSEYQFIEPSSGQGSFYKLLPKNQRIGIDLMPIFEDENIIRNDFLSWMPSNKKNIVVGNPPFGYRAWLALNFINHSARFSDYIGMILPMSFQSDGKGSPKHRVKGMRLVHSEILPNDSFETIEGKTVKINALWQIWEKGENIIIEPEKCDDWIDIFTVDMRKERLCGHEKMDFADFFLQRTFYNEPPSLVKNFSEVKYTCGYGLIFKKDKKSIMELLNSTDWYKYSNLAAHNCRHISMYHINKVLTDNGFKNG